jgi:DNA polymerase I
MNPGSQDSLITCRRAVFFDSEFDAKVGLGEIPGPPIVFCAIEVDLENGSVTEHRLAAPYPERPPWDHGDDDPYLAVGFALGAEAGSMMHIGWPFPVPAVDLYAEYMVLHNTEMSSRGNDESGKEPGPSLIKACRRYGVPTMEKAHKDEMRALAYSKTEFPPEEIAALQNYCLDDDCRSTLGLFRAMRPRIDLARAPLRGAFMMELERMRWHGPPIDMPVYQRMRRRRAAAATGLRAELNRRMGAEIYFAGVFKRETMFRVMRRHSIPIPIDPRTGKESLRGRFIKGMIETYPLLKDFYEFRRMLDVLRDVPLEIGADGRNRCWQNPFGQKTGRNNPSTNRWLWGLPHTMRSLMKPPPGMAIAQVDIGNEEIGIAAFLSRDPTLIADYLSGDPYEQFAREVLGVLDPTRQQRQVYKACVLGRIYGMGPRTLARNLGISVEEARRILEQMHERYPVLNAWLERVVTKAMHGIPITCVLGWSLSATGCPGEERTFLDFPMQGNASELLRLVIVRAGAAGIPLIGCAHDSFLIEAPIAEIEQWVARLQEIIRSTSRELFGGELRAECKPNEDIVRHPDRFVDEREREEDMRNWNWLMALTEEAEDEHERRDEQGVGDGRHGPGDDPSANGTDAGVTAHQETGEAYAQARRGEVPGQVGAHPGGVAGSTSESSERPRY